MSSDILTDVFRWSPIARTVRSDQRPSLMTGAATVDQHTREQFFISALVTEHFVLQSARGAMVGEMVGRGSIYLGSVSAALIAFGFTAQSGVPLAPIVTAVLPALFILGELTFIALLRDSLQNIHFLLRIQRIRGYYRTLLPEAEEFFDPPEQDSELAAEMATVGLHSRPGAMLFTGASTIAAINSILGGAGLALLLTRSIRLAEVVATAIGVAAAAVLFAAHLMYEHRQNKTPDQPQAGRTAA